MKRDFINSTLFTIIAILMVACTSTKEIAYFQDAQHGDETVVVPKQITLQPEDKITIVVNTRKKELSDIFNLPYISRQLGVSNSYSYAQGISAYTIDVNGEIDFPEIGKIKIAGMTREEVSQTIKNKLIEKNLLTVPAVVTVEFANLKISVLGEVKNPGRYNIDRDAITLLDAISLAGDLTIHGQRTNIRVIRSTANGTQKTYCVNLCSLDELQASPVYYLQQNDVIYVEPNEMRARQSTVNGNNVRSSSFWISLASLLTSISLIFVR
ncbi:MAG: polysaccharide biosynthesis/export family protein [Bacteroidaceae bacterium]|nr:polysaccharide biosynthesis/export family protein [Bacteroidaceae bacterium]